MLVKFTRTPCPSNSTPEATRPTCPWACIPLTSELHREFEACITCPPTPQCPVVVVGLPNKLIKAGGTSPPWPRWPPSPPGWLMPFSSSSSRRSFSFSSTTPWSSPPTSCPLSPPPRASLSGVGVEVLDWPGSTTWFRSGNELGLIDLTMASSLALSLQNGFPTFSDFSSPDGGVSIWSPTVSVPANAIDLLLRSK